MLDGMFGICVVDAEKNTFIAARDPVGIKPLYHATMPDGSHVFASELKAIVDLKPTMCEEVPAGHYFTPETGYVRYYRPEWDTPDYLSAVAPTPADVKACLKRAIKKRMMSDVPFGLLLSGGLDSCVVAQMMVPMYKELKGEEKLKTFTVGQENSPDLMAARTFSQLLGTEHYEYIFTNEEAFEAIEQVVYHTETYSAELIRSCIPNYFLAKLASSKVKMVLTGEGADEIFCGYLYFRDAPDANALQNESRRIYHHLQNVNLQRADRMTMAHALEARVPFLDTEMLELGYAVDPAEKMITDERMEKMYLRDLFKDDGIIPQPLLYRTKAMQCEGVGQNWVDNLQAHCEKLVSDEQLADMQKRYTINPPESKEEAYYRSIFEKYYPSQDKFVHVWEGGCRAGGAPWKNEAYTRFGLKDTDQLGHAFQDAKADAKTEGGSVSLLLSEAPACN